MATTTHIPIQCSHCGRPIAGNSVQIGPYSYHDVCAQGPRDRDMPWAQRIVPPPPPPAPWWPPTLTEADVRRIVREELERTGVLVRPQCD